MEYDMKYQIHIPSLRKSWALAAALLLVDLVRSNADDFDSVLIQDVPAAVAAPAPVAAQVEVPKPADKDARQKKATKVERLTAPIWYPTIYPNPLAFNMTWVAISDKTLADV